MPHSGLHFLRIWCDLVPKKAILGAPWRPAEAQMAPKIAQMAPKIAQLVPEVAEVFRIQAKVENTM